MINTEEIISLHDILIEENGGSKGVRDFAGLDAAVNRPFATFDGIDLYPDFTRKACAIFESLIINHPFIDGNKRIAYLMLELLLLEDNLTVNASQNDKYEFVISASTGVFRYDEILQWIRPRLINNTNNSF